MKDKYEVFVNEQLGVVVARLSQSDFMEAVFDSAAKKLLKKFKNSRIGVSCDWCSSLSDYVYAYFMQWARKRNIGKNVVTRARCNFEDGDVFDEQIGTYIACDRMDMKIARTGIDFLHDFMDDFNDFLWEVDIESDKLEEFYENTAQHVENLISMED